MADATGEAKEPPLRVAFDRRIKLEFHGARITSDGGLLAYRELDDTFGLTTMAALRLAEGRRGKNIRHRLLGLLRQAVYGRLAGYEDVNDAERLARDPAMRAIVGREGLDRPAASTSQMGRLETEWLATEANLSALTACPAPGSTACTNAGRPTASSSTWTAPRARPMASRRARPGTGISAAPATTRCSCSTSSATSSAAFCGPATSTAPKDWRSVLEPVIARYRERGLELYFRGDAAFAKPELYELLEAEGIGYAIRLPANSVLQERIGHLLTRPVGRPPNKPQVFFASFGYQAQSWSKPRRVVAKVEWHQGELYPAGRLHRHQPEAAGRAGQQVLQRPRHRRAVDQGGQAGAALDPAVLPRLPPQRRAAAALRPCLQPRQLPALTGAARRGRAVVADDACARSWSRSAPGSSATVATSSSSSPRWRCRGRCSPRSCAGSTACEDRPLRWPDRSKAWGGRSRGENHAPKSTNGARAARIRLRAGVERVLTTEIRRQMPLPIDRRSAKQQLCGCWPSASGECR